MPACEALVLVFRALQVQRVVHNSTCSSSIYYSTLYDLYERLLRALEPQQHCTYIPGTHSSLRTNLNPEPKQAPLRKTEKDLKRRKREFTAVLLVYLVEYNRCALQTTSRSVDMTYELRPSSIVYLLEPMHTLPTSYLPGHCRGRLSAQLFLETHKPCQEIWASWQPCSKSCPIPAASRFSSS